MIETEDVVVIENLFAREEVSGNRCLCTKEEKVRCYKTLVLKECRTSVHKVEALVRGGMPRQQAREVVMSAIHERARVSSENIVATTNKGYCWITFQLNLSDMSTSMFYQRVIDKVLQDNPVKGASARATELVKYSAEEILRVIDEGVAWVREQGGVVRYIRVPTTQLITEVKSRIV